jgi:hypothetical protein
MDEEFRTTDRSLAILLMALGASEVRAEHMQEGKRRKIFIFEKTFVAPLVEKWQRGVEIMVDYRLVILAEQRVNSLIYDEI